MPLTAPPEPRAPERSPAPSPPPRSPSRPAPGPGARSAVTASAPSTQPGAGRGRGRATWPPEEVSPKLSVYSGDQTATRPDRRGDPAREKSELGRSGGRRPETERAASPPLLALAFPARHRGSDLD